MKSNNKKKGGDDSDDDDSQASLEVNTDNTAKFIPIAKLGDHLKIKKIVINISDTQYPVIEQVAQQLGWVIQRVQGIGDWDVWWTDREIQPNTLFRMNLHQKINHFPGIYILAHKNLLGINLMGMRQHFPQQYNFFPQTWTIPLQFSQFRHYFESTEKGKIRTYIVKPQALSQGRGIFLTRNIEDIINGNKYVIQRYIKNPFLIDRLKFDLRIYVLMAGTDPLRLYIYHEGLTRFATQDYQQPNADNLSKNFIHLTNYSLNKMNPNYIYNSSEKDMDKGHKRTLSSTYARLQKQGIDVEALKLKIEDAIIKTVISGLPGIQHQYRYCQPEEYQGGMCFHILGFDVMLTSDLKPIVIEVNHTPSFETGTPLDYMIKKNLIVDTLKLMRITQKNKRKHFQRAKQIAKARLQKGKRDIFKGKQRQQMIKKARHERDQLQKNILGGYKKIYPPQSQEQQAKYNRFIQTAIRVSKEVNQTRKKILSDEKVVSKQESKTKKQRKSKNEMEPIQSLGNTVANQDCTSCFQIQSKRTITPLCRPAEYQDDILEKIINDDKALQSVMRQSASSLHRQDDQKRTSFRSKISTKKNICSNNQLTNYTSSIKKFNDLMNKFVAHKEQMTLEIVGNNDAQVFNQLKQKINAVGQPKTIVPQHPQLFAPFGQRQSKIPALNPNFKHIVGFSDIRLQGKNGSFVKPKNYLINESPPIMIKQQYRKNSSEKGPKQGRQFLLGGLVIENHSLKAYSKHIKNVGNRNAMLNNK